VSVHYSSEPGSIQRQQIAECFDCHLILVEPNQNRTRLTVVTTGCSGTLGMFESFVHEWDQVQIFDESDVLPPNTENRMAGVVRFSIPFMDIERLVSEFRKTGRKVTVTEFNA
jgi:hypothetical protein